MSAPRDLPVAVARASPRKLYRVKGEAHGGANGADVAKHCEDTCKGDPAGAMRMFLEYRDEAIQLRKHKCAAGLWGAQLNANMLLTDTEHAPKMRPIRAFTLLPDLKHRSSRKRYQTFFEKLLVLSHSLSRIMKVASTFHKML